MALRNQIKFATPGDGARARERTESGTAVRVANELAELEPETETAPGASEDVGGLGPGLPRLIGNPGGVLETIERPTPAPTPPHLPLVPIMDTVTSSTIASWKSPSPAPSISHDLNIQDVLLHSLPLPQVPPPFQESLLPESPVPVPSSARESSPVRQPPIQEFPIRGSATSSSASSSRPPSAHSIAVVVPTRPVVTWEEAARLQRIAQAPPRRPQPPQPSPRRSTRVQPSTQEKPAEGQEKKRGKQERNRLKRAKRRRLKQLKASNAAPTPLSKSVPQDAVGDQRQSAVGEVDLEVEEQEQGYEQGQDQMEDGEGERELTARERVMQWQLENGKMPVGRYKAPVVRNRRNRS